MDASRFCYSSSSRPPLPCFLDKSHTLLTHLAKPIPSFSTGISCGLRGGPRKPLWRKHVLSTEAIQAVQALKFAKSFSFRSSTASINRDGRMAEVFSGRIARLLKNDLLDVLEELQRQNEWEIALQVFDFIKKEVWYKPNLSLYSDMILMMGKNKFIKEAEKLFAEVEKGGLRPDTRVYTEIIGAYLKVGDVDKAMEIYKLMKDSGCNPDKLTFSILFRSLEKARKMDIVSAIRKDCEQFVESPEKFLEEVDKKYPKKRSLRLV